MKKIYLQKLQNAEHLAFMSDVAALLQAVGNTFFDKEKEQLMQSVTNEELANKEIRKSEHTSSLSELDTVRDNFYRGLLYRVKSEVFSKEKEVCRAAEKVMLVVDTYGNFTKHNYQKETTEIQNFITDLKSEEYSGAAEKIGLTQWVTWLDEANKEFHKVYALRRDEYASRPVYDLKNIRKESDEIFKNIQKKADALLILQPSEELTTFVAKVETSIEKWKEVLAQRKGKKN